MSKYEITEKASTTQKYFLHSVTGKVMPPSVTLLQDKRGNTINRTSSPSPSHRDSFTSAHSNAQVTLTISL